MGSHNSGLTSHPLFFRCKGRRQSLIYFISLLESLVGVWSGRSRPPLSCRCAGDIQSFSCEYSFDYFLVTAPQKRCRKVACGEAAESYLPAGPHRLDAGLAALPAQPRVGALHLICLPSEMAKRHANDMEKKETRGDNKTGVSWYPSVLGCCLICARSCRSSISGSPRVGHPSCTGYAG